MKLTKRKKESHKGDYGKIALVGGSRGMAGSIYLSTESSLRTGSGLVYSCVPKSLELVMSIKLVEAILCPLEDGGRGHLNLESLEDLGQAIKNKDALGIGPGMARGEEQEKLMEFLLDEFKGPMVIDADGINNLRNKENLRGKNIIITPHEGEFARFLDIELAELVDNRVKYSMEASRKYGIDIVLKGHKTIVTNGESLYLNNTGNPGMATAGSGDVLTGMILSLLGQGYSTMDAGRLGVYLHGLAGDYARDQLGEDSLIARDLIDNIPKAILDFKRNKREI